MHHVRTIGHAEDANTCVEVRELRVLADAVSAMHLNCLVNDLQAHTRRVDFGHGNVGLGGLEAILIRLHRSQVAEESGLGDLHPCLSHGLPNRSLVSKDLAESCAVVRTMDDGVQSLLGTADGAHAMVDA